LREQIAFRRHRQNRGATTIQVNVKSMTQKQRE
jgi:hypothetical protein